MTPSPDAPPPADSLFDPALLGQSSSVAATDRPRQIVLVGAGHAHLHVLEGWGRQPIPHAELVLISANDRAVYSGMVPGILAGLLEESEGVIDLRQLAERIGARLIVDRVIRLDPGLRRIELAHQPAVTFDVASINIGSATRGELLCRQHRMLVCIKPLATFLTRLEPRLRELEAQYRAAPVAETLRFGVVGGGAAGVELALALERHLARRDLPSEITLYDGGRELLATHPPRARRLARQILERRGITVELGRRVVACHDEGLSALILDDGVHEPCDLAVWVTGPAPPEVLQNFDLPKSDRGFLRVRSTLQTIAQAPVFIVGDAADWLDEEAVPKAGVYAVRQGPVLWQNLRRWFRGEPLQPYEPQRRFLALLSCADGTALLDYAGFVRRSRWAWWLKLRIDRQFMRRFR